MYSKMKSNNVQNDKKGKSIPIKSKNKYDNVKNKNILKKIFSHLLKDKLLEIIKYNKTFQRRLNINFNDYKEFSEIYTSIEIEIIPANKLYGKFIGGFYNEKQLHFYFNDNKKEEIKTNYFKKLDKIQKINIVIDYQFKLFTYLFDKCDIEFVNFKKFHRNNINDMSYMFNECSFLKEVKFSSFNTENVTNMSNMFSECSSLEKIELSNFNGQRVKSLKNMFKGCSSLKKINFSDFNTNNVSDMSAMFYGCYSLEKLNLSNFNTNKVTKMDYMFYNCSSLKKLNLSNFNFKNVANMSFMFSGCRLLMELNVPKFNINKITNIDKMFLFCPNKFKLRMKTQYNNLQKDAFKDTDEA